MPLVGPWPAMDRPESARARLSAAAFGMVVCDLAMTSQSDTLTETKFYSFVLNENNSIAPLKARPKGAYDAHAALFWCEEMSIVGTRGRSAL
jgi:hypothetical protein